MTEAAPLIEADGLSRDYGPLRAVDAVDLRLQRGEVLGLLGPNGAGKTSTMQMLCGTLAPTTGRIVIDGVDLVEQPRRAKAALGYLPERPPLYPDMTVAEFLRFAAALRRMPRPRRADAVTRAMARCGLDGMGGRLIGNLSLGYRQRVGIAQSIVHEPSAIVLDEPTVGLDPIQVREIRALIVALGRDHGVILSTHILPEVQAVCSRVAIMHQGRIAYEADTAGAGGETPDTAVLGLAAPPATAVLEELAGVTAVETLGPGRFRIRFDPGRTGPRALGEHAVHAGWGLEELVAERPSLEQLFVAVTARDAATAEAGAAEAGA